jgi:hypothetical protein
MMVAERAKTEKTFANVNRPASAQPLVANVRFQISVDGKTVTIEAKFQTAETHLPLYTHLDREAFIFHTSFEIRFMGAPIPRDDSITLASHQISGSIMLNVAVQGRAKLKVR